MKTLTLTKDEIKALQIVGTAYDCGQTLLDDLIYDWQLQGNGRDYGEALDGFTVELYQDARRALGEILKADCERLESGALLHPMLSREFTKKLVDAAYFDLEY